MTDLDPPLSPHPQNSLVCVFPRGLGGVFRALKGERVPPWAARGEEGVGPFFFSSHFSILFPSFPSPIFQQNLFHHVTDLQEIFQVQRLRDESLNTQFPRPCLLARRRPMRS